MSEPSLHLGTCSWKYPSWRGLVYSDKPENYLNEYSRRYDCVEIDQWFYSLFKDEVVLPEPETVEEYARSVPAGFRFGVKLPNALTLTHYPKSQQANPYLLSVDLLNTFMETIRPLSAGPLMLQFGYLNTDMMPSRKVFQEKLGSFADRLPPGYAWCVETRNPNYLHDDYFRFLRDHNLGHVWQQGYFMPPIFELYHRYADLLTDTVVIRLHGEDREGIEERSRKKWSRITEPKDPELDLVAEVLKDLQTRKKQSWAFVNNHYEGCAPLTIERIKARLGMSAKPEDPSLQCREIKYGSPEYDETVELRDRVLRRPLGLLFDPGQLRQEGQDFHLACYKDSRLACRAEARPAGNERRLAGCLVLTPLSATLVRMRQVAVEPESQRQGVGSALVRFAERFARERGFTEIMAHARESALAFYLKLGYEPVGARFMEVGIPHVEVRARLRA